MTLIADDIPLEPVPGFPNYFYNADDPTEVFRRRDGELEPVVWRDKSVKPGDYKEGDYKTKKKSYNYEYIVLRTPYGVRDFTRKSWLKYITDNPPAKEIPNATSDETVSSRPDVE